MYTRSDNIKKSERNSSTAESPAENKKYVTIKKTEIVKQRRNSKKRTGTDLYYLTAEISLHHEKQSRYKQTMFQFSFNLKSGEEMILCSKFCISFAVVVDLLL